MTFNEDDVDRNKIGQFGLRTFNAPETNLAAGIPRADGSIVEHDDREFEVETNGGGRYHVYEDDGLLVSFNFAGADGDHLGIEDAAVIAIDEVAGICSRHSGPWGGDETCARCTDEYGRPRPTKAEAIEKELLLERLKDANSFGGQEEFDSLVAEIETAKEYAAERAADDYRHPVEDTVTDRIDVGAEDLAAGQVLGLSEVRREVRNRLGHIELDDATAIAGAIHISETLGAGEAPAFDQLAVTGVIRSSHCADDVAENYSELSPADKDLISMIGTWALNHGR